MIIDFTFTSFQIRNNRINTGEKPFECDNHEKIAMTISLKTNMSIHDVEKFFCDYEYFGAHKVHSNSLSPDLTHMFNKNNRLTKIQVGWVVPSSQFFRGRELPPSNSPPAPLPTALLGII